MAAFLAGLILGSWLGVFWMAILNVAGREGGDCGK